ncbi:MAG: hypothetical protein K2P13_11445, partial [Lachnospiraceae bacterium]|nr:hypothetical protein [Lachnospiraceae bacterium]
CFLIHNFLSGPFSHEAEKYAGNRQILSTYENILSQKALNVYKFHAFFITFIPQFIPKYG